MVNRAQPTEQPARGKAGQDRGTEPWLGRQDHLNNRRESAMALQQRPAPPGQTHHPLRAKATHNLLLLFLFLVGGKHQPESKISQKCQPFMGRVREKKKKVNFHFILPPKWAHESDLCTVCMQAHIGATNAQMLCEAGLGQAQWHMPIFPSKLSLAQNLEKQRNQAGGTDL